MSDDYLALLPAWPRFAFGDPRVDGLVPACRVDGWESFIEAMRSDSHNKARSDMVYRGQRGHDWHLSSTLARLFDGGSVPEEYGSALLLQFKLAMRGRGLDISGLQEQEIWAFGQHNGLATPLIDWTKSPYVALFFAFEGFDRDGEANASRAVFCLNMTAVREQLPNMIFEPTHHENARLVNQAGLFTITPSGNDNIVSAILNELTDQELINPDDANDVAQYICKFHVLNTHRSECLNTLRKMNIHHASLFPDAEGAAKFCNDWLTRLIAEEKSDKVAADEAAKAESEKRVDPIAIARESGTDQMLVAKVLEETLRDQTSYPSERLSDWSSKLVSLYERSAETDWPRRETSRSRLKLEFRKFFLSAGVDAGVAETCARRLIGFFTERWRVAEGVEGDGAL